MSTFLIVSGIIASTAIIILGIICLEKPAKIRLKYLYLAFVIFLIINLLSIATGNMLQTHERRIVLIIISIIALVLFLYKLFAKDDIKLLPGIISWPVVFILATSLMLLFGGFLRVWLTEPISTGIASSLVVLIFSSWFKVKKMRYGEAAPFAIPIGIAVGLGMYLTEMFF